MTSPKQPWPQLESEAHSIRVGHFRKISQTKSTDLSVTYVYTVVTANRCHAILSTDTMPNISLTMAKAMVKRGCS